MTAAVTPLEARCAVCLDTGSKERDLYSALDCTACEAANERVALMCALKGTKDWRDVYALTWRAYQLGKAAATSIAEKDERITTLHRQYRGLEAALAVEHAALGDALRHVASLKERLNSAPVAAPVVPVAAQPEKFDYLAMALPRSALKAEDWDPATKRPRNATAAQPVVQEETINDISKDALFIILNSLHIYPSEYTDCTILFNVTVEQLEALYLKDRKQVEFQKEPLFWYRPTCGGEMYEGPIHNKSIGGKMLREERPGEWLPLYELKNKGAV